MMVTILATVTIVSLILTIALTALVVKLFRNERRRSAARSAALAQMAEAAAHEFGSFEEDATRSMIFRWIASTTCQSQRRAISSPNGNRERPGRDVLRSRWRSWPSRLASARRFAS